METTTSKHFHPVHEVFDGFMNTRSGQQVYLLDPKPETIVIEDIVGALGKLCRFNGQINRFYSVAQHSVLVAALAPERLRKAALLHDAPEAYLGDMIKPLKVIMGAAYGVLEKRFLELIAAQNGIEMSEFAEIKPFDMQATEAEHEAFQRGNIPAWYNLCLSVNLTPSVYGPDHAESLFYQTYQKIFNK